jgi:hypothetical protein
MLSKRTSFLRIMRPCVHSLQRFSLHTKGKIHRLKFFKLSRFFKDSTLNRLL